MHASAGAGRTCMRDCGFKTECARTTGEGGGRLNIGSLNIQRGADKDDVASARMSRASLLHDRWVAGQWMDGEFLAGEWVAGPARLSRSSLHDSQWANQRTGTGVALARRSPFGGSAYRSQILPLQMEPCPATAVSQYHPNQTLARSTSGFSLSSSVHKMAPATAVSQNRVEGRQTLTCSTSSLSSSVHEMVLSLQDQNLRRERARFFPHPASEPMQLSDTHLMRPRTSSSSESSTRIANWLHSSAVGDFNSKSKLLTCSPSKSAPMSASMSSKRLEPLCEPASLHDPLSSSSRASSVQIELLSRRRYAARLGQTHEASFPFRSSFN